MGETSLEKVLETALALPPEDRRRLAELLMQSSSTVEPLKSIEEIAAEQGKKPISFKEVRDLGSFFPEDESIDDLVNTVRELRRDKSTRDLG